MKINFMNAVGFHADEHCKKCFVLHFLRCLHLGCFKRDLDKVLLCTWGASISQAFVAKRAMNSFQDVFTNVHCRFIRNTGRASSYLSRAPAATPRR